VKRGTLVAVLVAALAAVIATTPVTAAPRLDVHIEALASNDTVPFVASGPAVDAGLLRATGSVSSPSVTVWLSPHGDTLHVRVVKHFMCDDGTFDFEVVATIDLIAGTVRGHWTVLEGTGNYTDLKGNGEVIVTQSGQNLYDGALAGAIATRPVNAAPMLDVHITMTSPFSMDAVPFVASGPAVDCGLLPATGLVSTAGMIVSPSPYGDAFLCLTVLKHFVCAGGTLDVEVVATLDLNAGTTSGHWRVSGGTGSYAGLKGNGKDYSIPCVPGESVYDFYDGRLKN
jgi:adhesin HecA-like repeat protein